MGHAASSLLLCRRRPLELRVLIFGLDAAGKTSVLYRLKTGELITTIPTIGFNVETVSLGTRASLTLWDIGGRDKMRALYRHYFSGSHGVLYVIDSNDRERLPESLEELNRFCKSLTSEGLPDIPMVVLCNKCDMATDSVAATIAEVQNLLSDEALLAKKLPGLQNRPISCFAVSAATGEGLSDALNWLVRTAMHEVPVAATEDPSGADTDKATVAASEKTAGDDAVTDVSWTMLNWSGLYHLAKSAMLR